MSYNAIVSTLKNVKKLEGSDFLQTAACQGYYIVVGLEAKEGDVVILFPDDGQLSSEYCYENNLYNKSEMNKDPNAKCGFFDHKRRVKAQTFRKAKSEAYAASLDSVKFTGYDISTLKVGDQFNELNGVHICNKYFTEGTKKAANSKSNIQKGYNKAELKKLFPEHTDTDQIRFATDDQLKGLNILTFKQHGTSQRTGYIKFPVEIHLKWYHKLWNKYIDFVNKIPVKWANEGNRENSYFTTKYKMEWQLIQGTRRVIKGKVKDSDQDYRSNCSRILAPHIQKGEIWYYEIVGYEDTGASIMQSVSTSEMPKEFKKRFGDTITYKYGCLPGTCDIYVYRITYQNEDGVIYELPWSKVKDKCNRAGIKHVPEIGNMLVKTENDVARLKEAIEYHTEEVDIADPIDESHIREGICIRRESLEDGSMKIWKNKTYAFKVLEGIVKSSDDYIDTEEQESIE